MGVELLYVSPGNFQAAREIIEMDPGSESLAVLREDHWHGPELVPESAGEVLWIIYPCHMENFFKWWESWWRTIAPGFRLDVCGYCESVPWEWEAQEREE